MITWVVKIFFVQFFCAFLPPLLNIFCFCQVHPISVPYCVSFIPLHEMFPWCLSFSWRDLYLSHSVVFLYSFAVTPEEGFLTSPCYPLELCIQMGISFLFSFAFCFSSSLSYFKASSENHFAGLHFFFLGMILITASWSLPPFYCKKTQYFPVLAVIGTLRSCKPSSLWGNGIGRGSNSVHP